MTFLLTAPQCFFIVILIFAVIGFQRGWRRELVSLGFSLGAVLFLYLGGGTGVAQFIFQRLPVVAQAVAGGSSTGAAAPLSQTTILITTIVTFAVIVGAGYLIGNRAFPKPNAPQDRLLGILPAIVSGYFLMLYLTNALAGTSLLTVGAMTPSQNLVGNYMLIIFIIAAVVVVAALIAASAKKASGKK